VTRPDQPLFTRPVAITAWGVGLAALAAVPHVFGSYWTGMVMLISILGLFALSHDLMMGHTGLVSLGQIGFFGVAAYTTALLDVRYDQPAWLAIIAGLVAAVVLAAILGFAVRSKGIYFILLTMALGLIVWGTAGHWTRMTRGDSGISGIRLPEVAGVALGSQQIYYYIVVIVTLLCIAGYARLVASPFGLTLRGIRESEERMTALGYRVTLHKYAAFVISGGMSGIAGIVYVYYNNFMSPTAIELIRAAEAVLAVIVGGMGTIAGPFIGAGIITIVRQELSASVDRWMTVLGLIFIVTALYASDGLMGQVPRIRAQVRRRLRRGADAQPAESTDDEPVQAGGR
jgi:branched-chain amino acid transport system permease protein